MPSKLRNTVRRIIAILRYRSWWANNGRKLDSPELRKLWHLTSVRIKKYKALFDHLHRVKGVLQYRESAPADTVDRSTDAATAQTPHLDSRRATGSDTATHEEQQRGKRNSRVWRSIVAHIGLEP